jgi:membrane protein
VEMRQATGSPAGGAASESGAEGVWGPEAGAAGEEDASIPPQGKGRPGPDTPLELGPSDWKETLKRTLTEIKDDRLTFAAAGMTYYFFLAIFPTLIAAVGILGFVNADTGGLIASIQSTLPGDSGEALTEAFREANRPSDATSLTAAIVGISVALWSASTGMVALQTGLNVVYDVPQDRKFLGKRAVGLLLVVATLLLGGVPSPIFTFGEAPVYIALGWLLTILAVMFLFSLFYYFAPNREAPTWQWVSVGGVVGATLWILALLAFGYYVDGYSNYSRTYGSLAGVVVLMLVLYLSSLAVLIGGELNAEMERQGQRLAASDH